MKCHELLNKENWIQGEYAKDMNGRSCDAESEQAKYWCLLGAINHCYSNTSRINVFRKVNERIRELYYPFDLKEAFLVARWNDLPTTTFDDVIEILRTLDV